MRAVSELVGVIVAGFVAFFGGIILLVGVLVLWFLGLVCAAMLVVSVFAGMMYLFTGKAHDGQIALVYLGYATVPFVMSFVFHVYRGKWADGRRQLQSDLNIGRLRVAQDARLSD